MNNKSGSKFLGFRCSICGADYSAAPFTYICPLDGGNLDVILDFERIKKDSDPNKIISSQELSIWRYHPLYPVSDPGYTSTPLHAVGFTPVFQPGMITKKYQVFNIWIKDESRNPTASFKDRASAMVIARAKEIKAEVVVTASTGNAGAALAGMAAAAQQKAVIFAPKTAPPAKVAQLLVYGARVMLVDGSYDQAFDLTIQASQEFGWYCRNTGYNPFTIEGKKSAAYEIWEWWETSKKSDFRLEDLMLFVSVGDGNIISGLYKGFSDLVALGWIDKPPKIIGVQAHGSAAIANAYDNGTEQILPVASQTIADSISVDLPRDGVRAVRAARESGGFYIKVSDDEILAAISELGKAGIFAEPAGATSFAGFVKAQQEGKITEEMPVMVINTGSGLKDVKAAMQSVGEALIIEPSLAALTVAIDKW